MGQSAILVIGATGDVGMGVVSAALASGRKVVAAGRNREKLDLLSARFNSDLLTCVPGDVGTEADAENLWSSAVQAVGLIEAAVVSVTTPSEPKSLMEWRAEDFGGLIAHNLNLHFIPLKVFQPRLPEDGLLIGIGGGTADFIIPKLTYVSMVQAAQRMLYKGASKECKSGAEVRELMIVSMVAGESNREHARPEWVTDEEVGRHVCAILDRPAEFPCSVLHLRSREQVGQPEK